MLRIDWSTFATTRSWNRYRPDAVLVLGGTGAAMNAAAGVPFPYVLRSQIRHDRLGK